MAEAILTQRAIWSAPGGCCGPTGRPYCRLSILTMFCVTLAFSHNVHLINTVQHSCQRWLEAGLEVVNDSLKVVSVSL